MLESNFPRPMRFVPAAMALWLAVVTSTAFADTVGGYDPFEANDPFEIQLASSIQHVASEASYDPFDVEHPTLADEVRPAVLTETSTVAFQLNAPTQAEPLPTPPTPPASPTQPSAEGERPDPDIAAAEVPIKPLCELSTNIVLPAGMLPRDYSGERAIELPLCFDPTGASRCWPVSPFNWAASGFYHNPLYFEEVNLERYGYGCGGCGCHCTCCSTVTQSFVSGAHFFGTVAALPYLVGADCPREHVYTLGHYRPGSCPPWRHTCCTRPSCAGGWSAAGVATGLVFLIP